MRILIHKRKNLSAQQLMYIQARMQGHNKEESKKVAKYSLNTSTQVIERSPNMKAALLECFKLNGLNEQVLTEKLVQGLNADKKYFFTKDGIVTDERTTPDFDAREKYLKDALNVRGDVSGDKVEVNLGIVQLPTKKSVDDWNKDELPSDNTNNANEEKID